MTIYLNSELVDWQQKIRSFVKSELIGISDEVERTSKIPPVAIEALARMGLFGTNTPVEYGGLGMSVLGSCIAIEELAAAHIAFYYTCGVNVHIGSKPIEIGGSEALKREYLPLLASGKNIAALAMTEPGAGSDASAIATSATPSGEGYILNGRKIFITNAQIADCFTVIARTDSENRRGGLSAFVVPKGSPGMTIGPALEMLGGAGSFHNEIFFQNCYVPAVNLIGKLGQGFDLAMQCLDFGRVHWAAYSVGLAQTLLNLAIDWTSTRVQFGKFLASNQTVQWELAEIAAEIKSARLLAYDSAWSFEADPAGRTVAAAMAKLTNGDMVFRTADRVLQLFGGYGYSKVSPVERMWRESRVVRILDGTSQMMKQIVGRDILRGANLRTGGGAQCRSV
jgi:alkylation response protein AidB-like acyl-CoA dehydrogenase